MVGGRIWKATLECRHSTTRCWYKHSSCPEGIFFRFFHVWLHAYVLLCAFVFTHGGRACLRCSSWRKRICEQRRWVRGSFPTAKACSFQRRWNTRRTTRSAGPTALPPKVDQSRSSPSGNAFFGARCRTHCRSRGCSGVSVWADWAIQSPQVSISRNDAHATLTTHLNGWATNPRMEVEASTKATALQLPSN